MGVFTSATEYPFELSFAGVPFCLDAGEAHRTPLRGRERPSPAPAHATSRKHQPEPDLLDEVDRLLPFLYGQEFELPSDYPGRMTGALARREHVGPMPTCQVRVGDYYYPTTASRWSVFRGLMTSTQVKDVLRVTGGQAPASFRMRAAPDALKPGLYPRYTVETKLYLLPPRPLAEHGGGMEGLYLVTLVDERYHWQHRHCSLGPVKESTWAGFIDELARLLGTDIIYDEFAAAYGRPEPDSQLWCNQENAAFLLDSLAANVGCTVVRKLDGTYRLMRTEMSQSFVVLNRGGSPPDLPSSRQGSSFFSLGEPVRTAGGDIFEDGGAKYPAGSLGASRNAVVPAAVTVCFPKYVTGDDPVPHFVNPRYANQLHGVHRPSAWWEDSYGDTFNVRVPIASGGQAVSGLTGSRAVLASGQLSGLAVTDVNSGTVASGIALQSGYAVSGYAAALSTTAKAFYSGEAQLFSDPVNVSGLTALAMKLAQDYYEGQVTAALDEAYPGTYAWSPEGIHDVVWTYSARARQAVCRVLRTQWNQRIREFQHSIGQHPHPVSGGVARGLPPGVGGKSVAQAVLETWPALSGGAVKVELERPLASGDLTAFFKTVDYLPTQNRWRGLLSGPGATSDYVAEVILFEGTSGGLSSGVQVSGTVESGQQIASGLFSSGGVFTSGQTYNGGYRVNIVYRGTEGSLVAAHPAGNFCRLLPGRGVGVNVVTFEKGAFTAPAEWTSGGIQGVNVIPPLQTVYAEDGGASGGFATGDEVYFSGSVRVAHPAAAPAGKFGEYVWLVERNGKAPVAGREYDGQLVGYSPTLSGMPVSGSLLSGSLTSGQTFTGPAAPVYLINAFAYSGDQPGGAASTCANLRVTDLHTGTTFSGVCHIEFDSTPTAYDDTLGDYKFQWTNQASGLLRVRLNGLTGNRFFYRYECRSGNNLFELSARADIRNGSWKIMSGTYT